MIRICLAFSVAALLFWAANLLAADVRYPLAVFCTLLAVVAFLVGVFLVSSRLGLGIANAVLKLLEFFSW
jgi:hypothetical protein